MKTAIITSKTSLKHYTGSGHPESISRVTSMVTPMGVHRPSPLSGGDYDGDKLLSTADSDVAAITAMTIPEGVAEMFVTWKAHADNGAIMGTYCTWLGSWMPLDPVGSSWI